MTSERDIENQIQDTDFDFVISDKDKKIGRRNIFSLFLGVIGGVAAATVFKARAQFGHQSQDHFINKHITKEITSAKDALKKQIDEINQNNNFYIQAKKLADYVSDHMSKKSGWAKMQIQESDWYPEPLTQKMKDIALHYSNIYSAWERLKRTNEKLSSQEKIFVAGANQHLKGAFHEVKSLVYKEIFSNIQTQVNDDKANDKIPDELSESDAVFALSKQLLIQLQISQYAVSVDILNSINTLILSKNPAAFNIPDNMKLPKIEDFQKILRAAISGDRFP
jgi:hypothetical protein